MRALALLAATAGCNAIFGLGDVHERDGSLGIDAPDPNAWPIQLTWQVFDPFADPNMVVTYPPIAGAKVEIESIHLTPGLHELSIASDGTFLVPNKVPGDPYRLVLTVDGIVTELHDTQLDTGHFVVPVVGRIDRVAPPADAEIQFNPSGAPATYNDARLYTIGLWTTADLGVQPMSDIVYVYGDSNVTTSLSGKLGSLEAAKGDAEVLVNFNGVGGSGVSIGFAAMAVDHLQPMANGPVTAMSTWRVAPINALKFIGPPSGGAQSPNTRLTNSLQQLYNAGTRVSTILGGVVPTGAISSFGAPRPGTLDQPVFLSLGNGIFSGNPVQFVNPFTSPLLPTAIYASDTTTRTIHNVPLTSGYQMITLTPNGAATAVMTPYAVGIPTGPNNTSVTLAGKDLANNDDMYSGPTAISVGQQLVDLKFGTDQAIDACVVTIYQLDTSSLITVRRFLVTQPPATVPLQIDAMLFDTIHEYTIGVTCMTGLPNAHLGDFTVVANPIAQSTFYSSTFMVTH